MHVSLGRVEEYHEAIVGFRKEICRTIGLNPEGPSTNPLPFAFYLFGFAEEACPPVGMVEFFFYDQMFDDYSGSVYGQACDLASVAPMRHMAHVRSVIIVEEYRLSRVFQYLGAAMAVVAHQLGARHMTAGTGVHNEGILALHRTAGMRRLGTYVVDGSEQQLSLLDVEPVAQRVNAMKSKRFLRIDPDLMKELRGRRRVPA